MSKTYLIQVRKDRETYGIVSKKIKNKNFFLTINGKYIKKDGTLSQYNTQENSTIQVHRKMKGGSKEFQFDSTTIKIIINKKGQNNPKLANYETIIKPRLIDKILEISKKPQLFQKLMEL